MKTQEAQVNYKQKKYEEDTMAHHNQIAKNQC